MKRTDNWLKIACLIPYKKIEHNPRKIVPAVRSFRQASLLRWTYNIWKTSARKIRKGDSLRICDILINNHVQSNLNVGHTCQIHPHKRTHCGPISEFSQFDGAVLITMCETFYPKKDWLLPGADLTTKRSNTSYEDTALRASEPVCISIRGLFTTSHLFCGFSIHVPKTISMLLCFGESFFCSLTLAYDLSIRRRPSTEQLWRVNLSAVAMTKNPSGIVYRSQVDDIRLFVHFKLWISFTALDKKADTGKHL